jgi:hypothetical protein
MISIAAPFPPHKPVATGPPDGGTRAGLSRGRLVVRESQSTGARFIVLAGDTGAPAAL